MHQLSALPHNLSLPSPSASSSLEAYLAAINQIPLLTQEEEVALTKHYAKTQDLEAAKKLVLSHLRFVAKIARDYKGYGLQLADLIQEGNIGLMKAVKRFEPKMGVRLVTFAVYWIKSAIHEYIVKNWRIVKIATTKAQRKLFFNLRKMKTKLGWLNHQEVETVAKDLNVKPEEVRDMEARLSQPDTSFDPMEEADENSVTPVLTIADTRYAPEHIITKREQGHLLLQLKKALSTLDARTQAILSKRWLSDQKSTLDDLSTEYGVSKERIRQIEEQALKKLKLVLST
jgi:RNA polymerase sigma-32 factor